jgi:hypothetical protein
MTVTFKIGTTDVTPSYSTINPISGTSASSGSWKYYLYYPSSSSDTTLTIGYGGGSTDAYMCFQAPGGSHGSSTSSIIYDGDIPTSLTEQEVLTAEIKAIILLLNSVTYDITGAGGGGGGGGQVYSPSLETSASLTVKIYKMGSGTDPTVIGTTSNIDSVYIDTTSINKTVGVGKNGSNAIEGDTSQLVGPSGGNGGDGGAGGGNGGSYGTLKIKSGSETLITSNGKNGTPGVGYNSGSSGSTGDNTPGYVSVSFKDGTKANLGSGGQQNKSGNTPFVMVYYKV